MELCCKRCGSEEHVKNGLMRTKQRSLCKGCGLNFTDTPTRGKPLALKVAAVLLYVSGLSMNRTAQLLGVSLASQPLPVWMRDVLGASDHLESFGQSAGIERRIVAGVGAGGHRAQAFVHDPLR